MATRECDDQVTLTDSCRTGRHDQAAIRGARELRDRAFDLTGVAHVDRAHLHTQERSHGLDGADCPLPEAILGSRRIAARVVRGAICLSSSSHFPLMPYSNAMKPVALPPGRARLDTKPAPTGSVTVPNTTGKVRVASNKGATTLVPLARITSGASAIISAMCWRSRKALSAPNRYSIRILRPTAQPDSCNPC